MEEKEKFRWLSWDKIFITPINLAVFAENKKIRTRLFNCRVAHSYSSEEKHVKVVISCCEI
jgi:hypothetical protein